jgi:sulfoxide reductase heme-binding subunit YedZ
MTPTFSFPPDWAPWRDRRGAFSALRAAAFAAVLAPAAALVARAAAGGLGADPVEAAMNDAGTWALRLLLASLAISPLRRIGPWPGLIGVRRMIGLAAFGYAAGHLALFVADQGFDLGRAAAEIAMRPYLAVGFATVAGLSALAATSFDAAIRALGAERWRRLHAIAAGLAAAGLAHAWLQVRLQDYAEPLALSGALAFLLLARVAGGDMTPGRALALAVAAAGLTALGEAAFLGAWVGAPAAPVLAANLSLDLGLRPAGWTLLLTAAPALAALALRAGSAAFPRRGSRAAPR